MENLFSKGLASRRAFLEEDEETLLTLCVWNQISRQSSCTRASVLGISLVVPFSMLSSHTGQSFFGRVLLSSIVGKKVLSSDLVRSRGTLLLSFTSRQGVR